MPDLPREVDDAAARAIVHFARVQSELEAEFDQIMRLPAAEQARLSRRSARIRELVRSIEGHLIQLRENVAGWAAGELPNVYASGVAVTSTALAAAGIQAAAWSQIHQTAVQVLATDLFDDILRVTRFINDDTKRLVGQLAEASSWDVITAGQTPTQAARPFSARVAAELRRTGQAAVFEDGTLIEPIRMRYADGSRHTVREYGEMLMRTKTGRAYNAGTINQGVAYGVYWFEGFDGADCGLTSHNDGELVNGNFFDADTAAAYPLSHPRCRRAWGPRPDLDPATNPNTGDPTEVEARRSTTPEQRASSARFEADLRARSVRRSRGRRRSRGEQREFASTSATLKQRPGETRSQFLERRRLAREAESRQRQIEKTQERRGTRQARTPRRQSTPPRPTTTLNGSLTDSGVRRTVRLSHLQSTVAQESEEQLQRMFAEYPMVANRVTRIGPADVTGSSLSRSSEVQVLGSASRPAVTPEGARGGTITLNNTSSHSPNGSRSSFAQGWHSSPHPAHTAVHEFGHQVDYYHKSLSQAAFDAKAIDSAPKGNYMQKLVTEKAGGTAADGFTNEVRARIAKEISEYASTSPAETFAEAFAQVKLRGNDASDLAKSIVKEVDDFIAKYEPVYGNSSRLRTIVEA